MYVERYGAGVNIYLGLHGWGGSRLIFQPITEIIPSNATFFSADLPGVSLSPEPQRWEVEEIVTEIIDTVSMIGSSSSPVTVVGHCGGAIFGLLAAIKSPQLIKRVVMIDPFAYLPRYFKVFLAGGFGNLAYTATFANPVGRWLTNQALRPRRHGEADLTASFSAANHETALRYLSLFNEMEKFEIPKNLRVPIDLVYGENSFGAVKKSVASLKKLLPEARVLRLKNAAHLPFEEATEELGGIIFEPRDKAIF